MILESSNLYLRTYYIDAVTIKDLKNKDKDIDIKKGYIYFYKTKAELWGNMA